MKTCLPFAFVLGVNAAVMMMPASASALVWHQHTVSASGEWRGGDPINGHSSFSQSYTHSSNSPSYLIHSVGLPVRVQYDIDDNVIDNALPSSDYIHHKFHLSYNATGDTSTREFRTNRTATTVFSILGGVLHRDGPIGQIAPFTEVIVEQGTYSAGVFTPGSVVYDLTASPFASVGAGTFRLTSRFSKDWFSSSTGFGLANNVGMFIVGEPVPEPSAGLAVISGLAFLTRRKKHLVK